MITLWPFLFFLSMFIVGIAYGIWWWVPIGAAGTVLFGWLCWKSAKSAEDDQRG